MILQFGMGDCVGGSRVERQYEFRILMAPRSLSAFGTKEMTGVFFLERKSEPRDRENETIRIFGRKNLLQAFDIRRRNSETLKPRDLSARRAEQRQNSFRHS